MKILFTGASSFTGMWFVRALVADGHEVVAPIHKSKNAYDGLRKERIESIKNECRLVFECPFGSDSFMDLIRSESSWDLLCHHAADVTNYKSPDFDPIKALENNTHRLQEVIHLLKEKQCSKVLLTGSVFEQREGVGTDDLRAVSPYGLSKGFTSDYFQFYCLKSQMRLGKFVIPNPFGPYEEMRFTSYLAKTWLKQEIAPVSHPNYVRDNVPVTLLAKSYAYFAQLLNNSSGIQKINPSYYVESQGAFTERFAKEMRQRFGLPCRYELQIQTDFSEPIERMNTDLIDRMQLGWSETKSWDELAEYYKRVYTS